jgi:hypothetical protein
MTPGAPPRWAVETADGKTFYVYASTIRSARVLARAQIASRFLLRATDERDVGAYGTDARRTS